jgi:GNAT superfamily N-acetyltransferase
MPPDLVLAAFSPADLDGVLAVVRGLQAHELTIEPRTRPPADIGSWYVDERLAEAKKDGGTFLVAHQRSRVVGYAIVFPRLANRYTHEVNYDYALLTELAVLPQARGGGIGRALIAACEAIARQCGARWLRINALAANQGALALYRREGFADRSIELEKPLS